jgi:heme-degrading monooxygenase HmoA
MEITTPSARCGAIQSSSSNVDIAEMTRKAGFVAINYITCQPHYAERFECLFCSRARAIDRMPGFLGMNVLKAETDGEPYLVVSFWEAKENFEAWVGSPEFIEGHKRGFEDLRAAKERGEESPMSSKFLTYSVLTD